VLGTLRSGLQVVPVGLVLAGFGVSLFYTGGDVQPYVAAALILIAAFAVAVWMPGGADYLDLGPAGILLALLALWLLASGLWSEIPYLSAIKGGVVGAAMLAYLVLRLTPASGQGWTTAAYGLPALGTVVAAVMIGQVALGQRPEASFLNVNTAAALVNFLWPFLALICVSQRFPTSVASLLIGLIGVNAVAIGLTGGRAVTLAFAASLGVFLVIVWGWASKYRVGGVVGAAVGGLASAHFVSDVVPSAGVRELGSRLATLAEPASAGATRIPIWEATVTMIAERPWLGWGPGTFFQIYPSYRLPEATAAGYQVHNDYLQYWFEGGLPAVILVMGVGIACLVAIVRLRQAAAPTGLAATMAYAAGVGLIGAAVHGLFSYNLQVMAYLIVVGIGIAAIDAADTGSFRIRLPIGQLRSSLVGGVAVASLLLVLVSHLVAVGAASHYTRQGSSLMRIGFYEPADEALATGTRLWSAQDVSHGLRGEVRHRALANVDETAMDKRQTLKSQGLDYLAAAIDRNPWRPGHYRIKAGILKQAPNPEPEKAQAVLRDTLELNPRAALARRDLARLLRERGDLGAALDLVDRGLRLHYAQHDPLPLMALGVELREQAGDDEGAARLREQLRDQREKQRATGATRTFVPVPRINDGAYGS